jgi:hypothetical protein
VGGTRFWCSQAFFRGVSSPVETQFSRVRNSLDTAPVYARDSSRRLKNGYDQDEALVATVESHTAGYQEFA